MFESRDGGGVSPSRRSTASPDAGEWNDPRTSPPAIGSRDLPHPDEASRFWASCRDSRIFETTDDGGSWTPRNRGLRADWPLETRIGYAHKLVMSPVDHDRLYQQNHVGMHRSDDAGRSWVRDHRGPADGFGWPRSASPRPGHVLRRPARPGTVAACPRARGGRRTRDAGSSWQRLDSGLPQRDAHLGVLREGLAIDALDVPGLYFGTSTGQVFASADEGETWSEITSYLPGIVGRGGGGRVMADVHLPPTLPSLFPDLPRRLEIDDCRRGDRTHGRALARPPRPAVRARPGATDAHQRLRRSRARRAARPRGRFAGGRDRSDQRRLRTAVPTDRAPSPGRRAAALT